MKKINTVKIGNAKLEQLRYFIQTILVITKASTKVMERCLLQVNLLEAGFDKLVTCLMNHKFNLLTQDIQSGDTFRDRSYSVMRLLISMFLESPDHAKRRAAEIVKKIFDSFGKIPTMGYGEQSGAMQTLCEDLIKNHGEELDLLGIRPMVEFMRSANDDFMKAYADRGDIKAEHIKGETQEARVEVIRRYRNLVGLVNILADSEGVADFEAYIDRVNVEVEQLRITLGQGASAPSDGSSEEEEFEEELEEEETEESEETETGGESSEGGSTGSGSNQDWDV